MLDVALPQGGWGSQDPDLCQGRWVALAQAEPLKSAAQSLLLSSSHNLCRGSS